MSSRLAVVARLLPQAQYQDSYTSQIHDDLELKIIWYLDPLWARVVHTSGEGFRGPWGATRFSVQDLVGLRA